MRLKRTHEPGVLETGAWLARDVRGCGAGRAAMAAVLQRAAALGARGVCADTTTGNASALGLLRRLGFDLGPAGDDHGIRAPLLQRNGFTDAGPAPDGPDERRMCRSGSRFGRAQVYSFVLPLPHGQSLSSC